MVGPVRDGSEAMKHGSGQTEILRLVRTVRRRWRLAVLLKGLAVALGLTVGVLFLSSLTLEWLRFSAQAVLWLRVVTWGTLLVSVGTFVILPLRKDVTDQQVALYFEEHEPSLDHAVMSAFELGSSPGTSAGLGQRLLETALHRARGVNFGRRVEQPRLYRLGGALTALAVASLVFMLLGPAHLRHGLSALLVPTQDAAAVNPYAVSVQPGDVVVARGTDQLVTAQLSGFDADAASVFTRSSPDAPFQRLSMLAGENGGFEVLLLAVADRTEYFVESTGIRSATFTIDVADLPYVDRLDLTYHFPSYTGLPPRVVEDGGDVVALPGTVVEIRVTPTLPTPGGQLVLDGGPGSELEVADDGTLVGRMTVVGEGFYSVELSQGGGDMVTASPEYTVDVLPDLDPSIRFTQPGRDTPASPIEEVYLEVRADDDYGVGDVRLVFSVNGGPEDTIAMFEGNGAPLKEVSTGHTLFLEEWELEPGDLVSYYGLVRDNRSRRGGRAVASDMYFVTVRPFERTYRQGEQQGGPPQGGGSQGAESALSEMQRQIISATFNLIRQQDSYSSDEFSENVVSVALAQGRLIEQVETLLQRMVNRGLTETDEGFRDVSAILPRAAEAMRQAQGRLEEEELRDAIPDEQTALRYLQQAEETYERYVVQQQAQQGGGGGGGQSAAAEDLADLFELELDKLKNQYETVRRGQQETADNEVDEVLEQLKELSRRLEQAAERQRRRAQQGGAPSGSGEAQREMADEAEEAARQLQRLARETGQSQLEETARQLQQAAESMRQSAAQRGAAGVAEANSALDRLEEAQRRLQRAQDDRARREAEEALARVDELARQQREVQRDVRELPQGGQERSDRLDLLRERKDQMTEAVSEIERELDRASSVARGEQPEAARKLKGAADQIRESKLKEKLQFSRGTMEQWDTESAVTLELNIEADLQTLRDRLEEAAATAGERQADPLEEALEDTRELVRGLEALDRRLRDPTGQEQGGDARAGEASENRQGQEAQQGRPGQGDQGSQQGQAGQQEGRQQEGQGGATEAGSDRPTDVRGDVSSLSGGATRGNPRRLSAGEVRQFRREFLERSDQVRNLEARLDEAGLDAADLQAVIQAMQRLQGNGIYDDPTQVALLQDEILETLKRLEFGLRRQVEGGSDGPASLAGSGDVPDEYRRLVEEYYRKLAASGRGGGATR
jgi:hypothetical protein